jgi:hypothetical protein
MLFVKNLPLRYAQSYIVERYLSMIILRPAFKLKKNYFLKRFSTKECALRRVLARKQTQVSVVNISSALKAGRQTCSYILHMYMVQKLISSSFFSSLKYPTKIHYCTPLDRVYNIEPPTWVKMNSPPE